MVENFIVYEIDKPELISKLMIDVSGDMTSVISKLVIDVVLVWS